MQPCDVQQIMQTLFIIFFLKIEEVLFSQKKSTSDFWSINIASDVRNTILLILEKGC